MKNRKKFLLFLILLLISFSVLFIVQIYARYLSSAEGNTSLRIANWNILVNDISILNNTDISSTLVPVFEGTEHIASDIIAPTAEGYVDLNLNFENVGVSFEYSISASASVDSSVQDLVLTGYSVDDAEKVTLANYNDPITDKILLHSGLKNRKIRLYILWNDNPDTQEMNNYQDTASLISDGEPLLNVKLEFKQVAEE